MSKPLGDRLLAAAPWLVVLGTLVAVSWLAATTGSWFGIALVGAWLSALVVLRVGMSDAASRRRRLGADVAFAGAALLGVTIGGLYSLPAVAAFAMVDAFAPSLPTVPVRPALPRTARVRAVATAAAAA